jgi:hypothetical protein
MLAVSVALREPGGFYVWGFDLVGYRRFVSAFFGGILLISVLIAAGRRPWLSCWRCHSR